MAKGNTILLTANPKGNFLEGVISGTPKPGTIVGIKAATALQGGDPTWVEANPGSIGLKVMYAVLLEDIWTGRLQTDAYVDGARCRVYCPLPGDDLNLLVGEAAGTSNTFAIGDEFLIGAGVGKLVPNTGSPQDALAICMEVITQSAKETLVFCRWMG